MSPIDLRESVPPELRTSEFALRPITADDAATDHDAVMDTREHLRLWEQSSRPEDDFTVKANRADLVDLEERHAAGRAYTYTVQDPLGTEFLGCVYDFPTLATFLAKATVTATTCGQMCCRVTPLSGSPRREYISHSPTRATTVSRGSAPFGPLPVESLQLRVRADPFRSAHEIRTPGSR